MRPIVSALCIMMIMSAGISRAQEPTDITCEALLTAAETTPDDGVYDRCGFGNADKAWQTWAPFVSAHNMKRALFELCRRYPQHQYGLLYCQKAIDLNYGPALVYFGDISFQNGNGSEALKYFSQAAKATDLSEDDVRRIQEKTGLLYLEQSAPYYNPQAGVKLLSKAAEKRSAVAGNAIGYILFSGYANTDPNWDRALRAFWKAALLGCPAAEENLGAFYLSEQGKISHDDAAYYMSLQAFTCTPFDKQAAQNPDCDCTEIAAKDKLYRERPYLYIGQTAADRVILQDKTGQNHTVRINDILPDGSQVAEITPALVVVWRADVRTPIARYPSDKCAQICLGKGTTQTRRPVSIKPYRFTFTPQECREIRYYAEKLLDTTQPYTGKAECAPTDTADQADLFMAL